MQAFFEIICIIKDGLRDIIVTKICRLGTCEWCESVDHEYFGEREDASFFIFT
jgi:hypothetical protein